MKKITLTALAAISLLSSCNKEGENTPPSEFISISTSIGTLTPMSAKASTRATSTAFVAGDQISVYAYESGDVTKGVVDNSINTYDGTSWTAVPLMKWKDMTSAHDFVSTFPTRVITDFSAEAVTLTEDIATNDVLVATTANRTASQHEVPLIFDHIMGKVVVSLTFRTEFDGTPTVTDVNTSAKQDAAVDFLTKTATATGTATDVSFTATTANTVYEAVIVPQTITAINIVIAGSTYTYTHPSDITIENGKIQAISLIVGRERIELGSISINDWTTGDPIEDGEALN